MRDGAPSAVGGDGAVAFVGGRHGAAVRGGGRNFEEGCGEEREDGREEGGKGASRGALLEEGSREMGVRRLSTLSAESTMSPSESSDGYGSVALITP